MTSQIVVAEIKGDQLIITLPVNPHPSKSGKTTIIATSGGNQASTATHQGKTVIIGVNAYVK